MVLTPGYIKVIAAEIASQIITELRKPLKRSSGEIKSAKGRGATYNDKDALTGCFKFHDRRAHKEI
jgi:hypothetical protein